MVLRAPGAGVVPIQMHRSPLRPRPLVLGLLLALALAGAAGLASNAAAAPPAATSAAGGRVIVLGFDGGDHRTAAALAAEGRMPKVTQLAETGTFAPLGTTYSAESPVAWAALNTGQNPSKTGVPGFVKRVLKGQGNEVVETDGTPFPEVGHQIKVERSVSEMDAGPLIGFLARYESSALMGMVGVVVFLGFLLAFKVILRLKTLLSTVLSLVLGAVGAFGAHTAKSYVPESIPDIVANPVEVDAFWDHAARGGSKVVVIDAAMAWDKPPVGDSKVLGGLGLPDCRGDNGQWFIYTTSEDEIDKPPVGRPSPTAGTVFKVPAWRNDRIESTIFGPKNFYQQSLLRKEADGIDELLAPPSNVGWKEGSKLRKRRKELKVLLEEEMPGGAPRASLPLVLERQPGGAAVTIGGQTQELSAGVWSDWYRLAFEMNPLIKAHAVTRVKIIENDETFTLFVNTLDIDPANPQFWQPVSQPRSFSSELAKRIGGPFETFGWACLTMPFKDKVIDAETMLQDIEFTMKWREELTRSALEDGDFDVLMSVFSTPDRVQHMCYQFYDVEHPLYDPEKASQKVTFFGREIELREAIPVIYEEVDRIIAWVTDEFLEPEDTLIVCADHGFQSFRHQVHLNNWLEREGYLVTVPGLSRGNSILLGFVDWSKTRAYAMGLGMIYLNLEGREAGGIVKPAEKRALLEEISGKLTQLTDDRSGESVRAVEQVVLIDDVHDGPFRDREGDMMVGLMPTYRVSWSGTSGGIELERDGAGGWRTAPIFEPNKNNWSGGHVSVAPKHVAGMFLSNRKVEIPADGVHLLHIAPTALKLLGHGADADFDREALQVR
jgi:predicted AlkP superfamily phosphohydrolase/phosphomutase